MIKNIFLFLFCFFILNNCGYKPIYSTKNLNFTIGKIEKENTSLNNEFVKVIEAIKNNKSNNEINIKIQSDKEITTESKDSKGNALIFELKVKLNVLSVDDNINKQKNFERKITYKNLNDKFKLRQYEKELEKILINKLVEDLINYFSTSNDF